MKKKRPELNKVVFAIVFVSLLLSVVYAIVQVVLSPSGASTGQEFAKMKSDYALMLVQCVLGVILMLLPSLLSKKLKFDIPKSIYVVYAIFLYCAIYLGEVRVFYYKIPFWDTMLHAFSGAMLGAFGFVVVDLLNRHKKTGVKLSPIFVSLFAFCFALSLGTLWEIYEFSMDGLLGLNMQKYRLWSGEDLVGRAALMDTIKDLIVDAVSAFSVSLGYYLYNRHSKGTNIPAEIAD